MRTRLTLVAIAALVPAASAAQSEWLSLGSKHWAPTVTKKSGIGTENAVAEAKVTRQAIEGWCANWSPGDPNCVRSVLDSPEAKQTYRASANCIAGRITPVDGNTYTLAGRWDNADIGGGRSRWRDASGRIVGRDNASGGLGISQQWELLCPETSKPPRSMGSTSRPGGEPRTAVPQPAPRSTPPSASPAPATTGATFAVGEIVYARYGPAWVRGRVTKVSRVSGARGPELAYNVTLDNGEKGLLPATMMRKTPSR